MIKKIQVDREIGLTVYIPDHETNRIKTVKLGYNDYSGKYSRLKNVLFYIKNRQYFSDFESIDLNNLNRIVVNPVRMASPTAENKEV